jgi:hypothetical protein
VALREEPVMARDLARLGECDGFRNGEQTCDRASVMRFRENKGKA